MARIVSLAEAVAATIHDGDSVAMEGFTHLIPFAAGHELIRQQRRDLTLIRMTPDVIYDQLIGAGCASRLIFSWGGNPGVGSPPPAPGGGGEAGARPPGGGERVPRPAAAGRAQPRRHGEPVRGRCRRPPVRGAAGIRRDRPGGPARA